MTEASEDRLIWATEAAQILQVTTRTIQRWEKKGLLTGYRPNPTGQRRYRESQVRELLGTEDN